MYRAEMYRADMYRAWTKSLLKKSLMLGSMGLACSLTADSTFAQSLINQTVTRQQSMNSEQIFGQAVHQYFAGQYQEAVNDLTLAIDAGIDDPRLYYYRGLAKLQMGDTENAEMDFNAGADIEARFAGRRNFNIGRSLMRVQGETRMMIENARAQSRVKLAERLNRGAPINRRAALAAMQNDAAASTDNDSSTLGSEVRPNLPDLSGVNDPTAPFSDQPRTSNNENTTPPPRNNQPTLPANDPFAEPADQPAPANTQPMDDPFAEPTGKQPSPAGNDPFDQPTDPVKEPAGIDPFAEPAADSPTEATPAVDPFAEPEKGTTETPAVDPFAEPASFEQPEQSSDQAKAIPENVRGGKILAGLFGALSAPVKKAANAGANAVQSLGPGALPGGPGEPGAPAIEPGNDPFSPSSDEDPFKN